MAVPFLKVNDGPDRGACFVLPDGTCSVGRGTDCMIRLTDPGVSRHHATLGRDTDGTYTIQDSGSTYGTFVDGKRVESAPLRDRSRITLGLTELVFHTKAVGESASGALETTPTVQLSLYDTIEAEGEGTYAVAGVLHEDGARTDVVLARAELAPNEQVRDLEKRLRAVYDVSEAISYAFDLPQLYRKILQTIFDTIQVGRAGIVLKDPHTGQLVQVASRDRGGNEGSVPFSRTMVEKVIHSGQSLLLQNAQGEKELSAAVSVFELNIRSALCVPIRTREEIIGVLHVQADGFAQFSDGDLRLTAIVGNLAGMFIKNARLAEENIASARLAAVGQTVAGLAHCIRNIVQVSESAATLMDEGLDAEDVAEITAVWPLVRESQQRITQLVMNMLDFSKERKPAYERVDLRDSLRTIHALAISRAAPKRATILLNCSEQTPPVECDPAGIYRATLNLVLNAVDAVPEDRGRIVMDIRPDDTGNALLISVSDNGPGIAPQARLRLFEPFHSTKGSKGTGLGLAVSRKIAVEHGGDISVETAAGHGATFTLKIPLERPVSTEES